MADAADRHALYQQAVNAPDSCIDFILDVYRDMRGRQPRVLREDFCGTALLTATWVKRGDDRSAIGIDIDPKVLLALSTRAGGDAAGAGDINALPPGSRSARRGSRRRSTRGCAARRAASGWN